MRGDPTPRQRRGSFGTKGFYVSYIERLIQRRAERGEPPASEVHDSDYWEHRRRNEAMKELPLKKAA
jgi:hypothetical protein